MRELHPVDHAIAELRPLARSVGEQIAAGGTDFPESELALLSIAEQHLNGNVRQAHELFNVVYLEELERELNTII